MSLNNLEVLFDKSKSLYCFINMNTHDIVYVNKSFCDFFKSSKEALVNQKYYNVLFGTEQPAEDCIIQKQRTLNESFVFEEKIADSDFSLMFSNLDFDGETICVCKFTKSHVIQNLDFSNAMLDCIEILRSDAPFEDSVNQLLVLITEYYDADGSYVATLNKEKSILDYTYSYCLANDIKNDDDTRSTITSHDISRWKKLSTTDPYVVINNVESELHKNTIEYHHLKKCNINSVFATPIKNGNEFLGVILITNPRKTKLDKFLFYSTTVYIKENLCRIHMINQLERKQNRDDLTGFLNRSEYNKMLNAYVETPPEQLGIIFCDINGLRKTNSDYGYQRGDQKIVECTQIMKTYFDYEFYRIGGDEFICFIEDLDEKEFYSRVGELRQETLDNIKASFSVGCTWRKGDKISVKQVADADSMMYLNKQKYYQNAAFSSDTTGIDMLQELLVAIKNDEFQVYLQPKIYLETGAIIGAEALVRRYDSENGKLIFPDQFIPVYENESIIRHVDLEVLRKVCAMQKDWIKLGKSLKISVNFSRITLKEDDIVQEIVRICDEYDVPHELIMVEITERIGLLDDADVSDNLISDLVLNGFNLSLDDFGCAYSNIVTLSKIDVNEVKIDKSLVDFLETNKKNQIIVRNIIDMCNEMENTETVSEGIETQEQANLLREFRCTQGQGFLYSKPIPAMDFYNKYIAN